MLSTIKSVVKKARMATFVQSFFGAQSPDAPPLLVPEEDAFYKSGVFPGAQGCVFVPSLIVQGITRQQDKRYVTKIFIDEASYTYEKTLNAFVKQIDTDSKFTNVKTNENPIDLTKISDEDIRKCGAIIESRANLATKKFLNYEYLGQSIHTIMAQRTQLTLEKAQNMLTGFELLANKLHLMNKGSLGKIIFHNDIHPGNIMFSPARKQIYLIDFGMATTDVAKRGKIPLFDLVSLVQVLNNILTYIITTVPNPTPKRTQAIQDFQAFIESNYLGKTSAPKGFVPSYTAEEIIHQIAKLNRGFSELGGKRKTKKQSSKKRVTLRRRKVSRNVH
jgi:serine/threonine protein kinase